MNVTESFLLRMRGGDNERRSKRKSG